MKSLAARACALAIAAAGGAAAAVPQHVFASAPIEPICEVPATLTAQSLPLSNTDNVVFGAAVACTGLMQSIQLNVKLLESVSGSPYTTVATGNATTSGNAVAESVNSFAPACTSGSQASFEVIATLQATAADGTPSDAVVFVGPTTVTCDQTP